MRTIVQEWVEEGIKQGIKQGIEQGAIQVTQENILALNVIKTIHQCEFLDCQQPGAHPNKALHHQMNGLLSRLDEQQRRWYVALVAENWGKAG